MHSYPAAASLIILCVSERLTHVILAFQMAMRVQTGFHGSRHRGLQSSHTLWNDRSDVCYSRNMNA
ncbi:hypothetical protein KC19_2G201700 [Ceratodon purpureus]|uniref:Secreted protein n=1 Tax=Ceratodon purpureus TaxID=3225 RepID=A0A8T0IW22_CERPU|nr:hypothetical protein KC19_2G201700 [Ceratodon purpureus]